MMKSFFKKLSLVMALAMVVTMMAPAASAFAADLIIAGQEEAKADAKAEYSVAVGKTVDLKFYGAGAGWQKDFVWESLNPEIATVDQTGLVTGLNDGVATIKLTVLGEVATVDVVVGEGEEVVAKITATQKTANKVEVVFTEEHNFDATGADADDKNTVKVYRVFSTEEMAKMANKNGLKFDEEGNGYQAYYVMDVNANWDAAKDAEDLTTWTISGYDWFVDGANYAVVYGPNETSSTIEGIIATFTAYVGKVASIDLTATDATVENDVEPAIPAYITCRLFNSHGIDLTDYYRNADETDYELLTEDIDVSVSGNEVTFDEVGYVTIQGSYTFYDEDLEEDVVLTDKVPVFGNKYSTYTVESIYNWSLKSGYGAKWSATTTEMIAGDEDQLYVIVKDNRGNYYSNVPGIEEQNYYINNVKVLEIGDGNDNTPFEQYGYELVFDSLDPDSLLVDPEGHVTTYKKTNSFAVVSYRRSDDESAKLHEIGVMGITVKAPRKLNSVKYNATSFTVLKETEAEDLIANYYAGYSDFKLTDTLEVKFLNQYGQDWADNAEDYYDVETNFTVTTSKDDFESIAEDIADALNTSQSYVIDAAMFAGTTTTSVTFKIKESATGNSTSVTIKLDKPRYVLDGNGQETDEVYVDPAKAIMDVANVELYKGIMTDAKLFQVSKASQKVGYVRVGTLENGDDEDRNYYLANALIKNSFVVNANKPLDSYVTVATGSAITGTATGSNVATGAALNGLKQNDYILVVTDPSGKVVPEVGKGGNGLAVDAESNIGLVASEDGTHFDFILAAFDKEGTLEYATPGTYRATVYKVTNANATGDSTKYTLSRVSSDSFTVTKNFKDVTFFHQETTKDVEVGSFSTLLDIKEAIAQTMTFKIAGQNFNLQNVDGKYVGYYQSYMDSDVRLGIEIIGVDYKIQNGGTRAVISNVTFRVDTLSGYYYDVKVKVNRSVNVAE